MYESVLSRAASAAEQAEVFVVRSEETPVEFEANKLKQMETNQVSGIALRIVKNGRIGLASTSNMNHLDTLVDDALATAEFGPPARFELPAPHPVADIPTYDPTIESISVEQQVTIGQEMIDLMLQHTPELQCEASVTKRVIEIQLLNNRGFDASYRKSIFSVNLSGLLVRGTDMLFVGDSAAACGPIDDYRRLVDTAKQQIELARRNVTPMSGPLPVIFTPVGLAMVLLTPLSLGFNGKMVLQGASPIGTRQGEQVFDPKLSVWDDATVDFRPGSSPVDDEGVATRPISLIENGVVGSFFYDLQTAGLAGTESTGHGQRSLDSLPQPSMHTVIVGTGDTSYDDMVREMKRGLIVHYVIGASQGNVLGGEFGGNVLLGYLVEDGEVVGRVKNTMIAGNIYEVLKNVIAVGREARWVGGSVQAPHLHVASVGVAGKE